MSDQTKNALDDVIRAHVASDAPDCLTTARLLIAGLASPDQSADVFWDGPDDQPGYVTVGLAHMLVDLASGMADDDE